MTDEVAALVLRDNVLQNLALSMTEQLGPELLDAQIRLMRRLQDGRAAWIARWSNCPATPNWSSGARQGKGLTRPECAVLLAYAKMTLYEDLLRTEIPDRAYIWRTTSPSTFRARCGAGSAERDRAAPTASGRSSPPGSPTAWSTEGSRCSSPSSRTRPGDSLEDIMLAYVVSRDSFGLLAYGARSRRCRPACRGTLQTRLLVAVREPADCAGLAGSWPRSVARCGSVIPWAGSGLGSETVMRQLDDVLGPEQVAIDRGRARRV